ncbi:MAG: PAS domain S-box protein [Dehalococcoidales bacterium]|nr:PAS domain S-box protein [Dehalococcoidales bacterium]
MSDVKMAKRQKGKRLVKKIKPVANSTARVNQDMAVWEDISASTLIGLYIVQEGKFKFVNPRLEEIIGYSKEELLGTESLSYVHPQDRARVRVNAIRVLKNKELGYVPYEYRIIHKSREYRWIMENVTSIIFEGKLATLGNFMDITDIKKAEEALRHSEQHLKEAQALGKIANYEFNLATEGVIWSEEMYELFERDKHLPPPTSQEIPSYFIREEGAKFFDLSHRSVDEGKEVHQDITAILPSGKTPVFHISIRPVRDDKGHIYAVFGTIQDITERKKAEEQLRLQADLLDSAVDAIYASDEMGNFIYVNEAAVKLHGYTRSELMHMKMQDLDIPETVEKKHRELFKKGILSFEGTFLRKNGSRLPVEVHTRLTEHEGHQVFLSVGRDISGRIIAQQRLKESEEKFRALFEQSRDAIFITSEDGEFFDINQSALDLHGFTRQEMLGLMAVKLYANPADHKRFLRDIKTNGSVKDWEVKMLKKDKSEVYCLLTAVPRKDSTGAFIGYQGIIRDITQQKQMENALKTLSMLDGLTGIPNRRHLNETLENEWLRARRNQTPISILMMDIDYFKAYNDHYGHLAGDDCLRQLAKGLSEVVRRPADMVARYGGEEFIFLLPDTKLEGAINRAKRVRAKVKSLNISHAYSPVAGQVTLSIGVASMIPTDKLTVEDLIKQADECLYAAKQSGRNTVKYQV